MLFNERDVKYIVAMPIIDEVNDDKRIWSFTPQGDYSVRSAYRYIMETLVDNSNLHVEGNCMKLWHLKVPHRLKVFLRRVACDVYQHGISCRQEVFDVVTGV